MAKNITPHLFQYDFHLLNHTPPLFKLHNKLNQGSKYVLAELEPLFKQTGIRITSNLTPLNEVS